jgi:hypothetical protein
MSTAATTTTTTTTSNGVGGGGGSGNIRPEECDGLVLIGKKRVYRLKELYTVELRYRGGDGKGEFETIEGTRYRAKSSLLPTLPQLNSIWECEVSIDSSSSSPLIVPIRIRLDRYEPNSNKQFLAILDHHRRLSHAKN